MTMSPAAQALVEGYGLEAEDAEPVAKAAAKLFASSQGYAEHVLASLAEAGDAPSEDRREAFCSKVAWGIYLQSAPTGGIEGLDRGLPEEAFADRKKRDKVAEEVMRHLDWREGILAAHPGMGPDDILISGFGLEDPGAERLSHVVAKILRMDGRFASAVLDTSRQEPEMSPSARASFLGRFASNVYAQHEGKIDGVPGNLGPIAFTRLWIRDLVAAALEKKASLAEGAEAQAQDAESEDGASPEGLEPEQTEAGAEPAEVAEEAQSGS